MTDYINHDTMHRPEDTSSVPVDSNLLSIFSITIMVVLGVSSIVPAFPRIMRDLHLSAGEVGLLISFFTAPGIVCAPLFGILADRRGRKKLLIPSFLFFGIAGGSCALFDNFTILLVLRFLQGIGASALGVLNVTIIGDIYRGKQRTAVLGYNNSILGAALFFYPLVGGGLALFGWRYPFFLPFAALPIALFCNRYLNNPEPSGDTSFREYISHAFRSVRSGRAIVLLLLHMVKFIMLYGAYLTYFPILLGNNYGASSLMIGVITSISAISTGITSFFVRFLIKRFSERTLIMAAFTSLSMAMAVVPFIHSLVWFVLPPVFFGIGMGLAVPCLQSLLTAIAPLEHRAAFLSLVSLALRLGQTLGPPLAGLAYVLWGMQGVFFAGAACSFAIIAIVAIMI